MKKIIYLILLIPILILIYLILILFLFLAIIERFLGIGIIDEKEYMRFLGIGIIDETNETKTLLHIIEKIIFGENK